MCRAIVNESRQRQLEEARENRRRRQRRLHSTRTVNPPFPDPLFQTAKFMSVSSLVLFLLSGGMITLGVFGVKNCHVLMFTGFPFWTGVHLMIVAIFTFVVAIKVSATIAIVQIVLAGFGIIFSAMSIFLAGFELKFTLNGIRSSSCEEEDDTDPLYIIDISLLSVLSLALVLLIAVVLGGIVTLGANPGLFCFSRLCVPDFASPFVTHNAVMMYRPGSFFPYEVFVSSIQLYEKVVNHGVFMLNFVVLSMGVVSFINCHAFRSTGLFLWVPLSGILFATYNFYCFSNATWCRITLAMILSSFSTLNSFVVMCFATGSPLPNSFPPRFIDAIFIFSPAVVVL